jgi:putative oxidoreductase
MKKLFDTPPVSPGVDTAILFIRIAVAALMLTHGIPKFQSLMADGETQFPAVLGMSATLSLTLTVFAEVFCSMLILFGLGTRLAVLPLLFTMLVAVLYIHAGEPFGKKELGLLYILPYTTLLLTGSGKYSIDYLLQHRLAPKPAFQRS